MNQKGMTLVELMVTLVVAAIIGIAVINMFTASNRTFTDQNRVIDMQRDGRLVMEYVTKTLRETGLNPLRSNKFSGILAYDPGIPMIVIDRDLNLNGDPDPGNEVVGFMLREEPLTGEKFLMRGFDIGLGSDRWQDMAKNVETFSVVCYNSAGGVTVATDEIRSIDVDIAFRDDKSMGGDFTRSYKTRVDLRNF